jgi:hypothetical protein
LTAKTRSNVASSTSSIDWLRCVVPALFQLGDAFAEAAGRARDNRSDLF